MVSVHVQWREIDCGVLAGIVLGSLEGLISLELPDSAVAYVANYVSSMSRFL